MLCNGCKREIEDDAKFCEYCGEKVEKELENLFCSSCGKQIENNSLFCKHCGASIGNKVTINQKDSKYKKIDLAVKIIIIALLVIIGLLVVGRYTGNKNTESDGRNEVKVSVNDSVVGDDTTGDPTDDTTDAPASSNKAKEVDGIYYTIVDKTLYISGEGDVDKKTINSYSKKDFDSVVFESGNIDIPDDTFSGFSNIKSVELRNVVQKIGARAFKGCGFWMIAIGKSVTEIGEDAFADCEISDVYLNNPEIRANLNNRDDFGGLFEYASTIGVFYSSSQVPDDDFTLDESGWGQYLRNNDEYSEILSRGSAGHSLAMNHYNLWAGTIRPGFFHFNYTTGLEPEGDEFIIDDYNGETNTFTFRE